MREWGIANREDKVEDCCAEHLPVSIGKDLGGERDSATTRRRFLLVEVDSHTRLFVNGGWILFVEFSQDIVSDAL